MFAHRHPRRILGRLLPAGLRVLALFGCVFAAAALLGDPPATQPSLPLATAGAITHSTLPGPQR